MVHLSQDWTAPWLFAGSNFRSRARGRCLSQWRPEIAFHRCKPAFCERAVALKHTCCKSSVSWRLPLSACLKLQQMRSRDACTPGAEDDARNRRQHRNVANGYLIEGLPLTEMPGSVSQSTEPMVVARYSYPGAGCTPLKPAVNPRGRVVTLQNRRAARGGCD